MGLFTPEEARFLQSQTICRLATASKQSRPHAVPVAYVFTGEAFYISTDAGSKKHRNLKENDKVSLLVDELKPKRGILVFGDATLLEGGSEYREAGRLLGWKDITAEPYYFHGHPQIVIKVSPRRKASWGF